MYIFVDDATHLFRLCMHVSVCEHVYVERMCLLPAARMCKLLQVAVGLGAPTMCVHSSLPALISVALLCWRVMA